MKIRLTLASEDDLYRIHEGSLKILSEIGCIFHSDKARNVLKKHGAIIKGETVYFPKDLVNNSIKKLPQTFEWRSRNPVYTTVIGGDGFRLAPNAGNIYVQDLDKGRRLAVLEDASKIQSIHQMSDITDFVGNNPCEPSDIDPYNRHLYVTYETLKHTDKPIVSYFAPYKNQSKETLEMVVLAFGENDVLNKHHVVGTSVGITCPLSYSADALGVIATFAEHNQPIMLTTAAMGGITGPLDAMGIALQQNAELLAGSTYIQIVNPGCPVVWGPSSTMAWMKTASYSTGTPEAMLANIICFQIANEIYKVPTRCMAGLTDSKTNDCQAGYETMQNLMLSMLGGAQIIYEALGVLDNILTTSYEKIIIDEELYSRVVCIHRGVDTSATKIPLGLIQEMGSKPEYLSHPYTLKNYRRMWRPTVSNWDNYSEWKESGSNDVTLSANKIWKQRLKESQQTYLDPEIDKDLKKYIKSHI